MAQLAHAGRRRIKELHHTMRYLRKQLMQLDYLRSAHACVK